MIRLCVLTAVLAGLVSAALEFAVAPRALASGQQVLADCNANGRLTHQYTTGDLRNALATMGASLKEYSDCYDVIQRALLGQVRGSHGPGPGSSGPGASGFSLPTPLIVALALLGLGAISAGISSLRRRGGPTRADEP